MHQVGDQPRLKKLLYVHTVLHASHIPSQSKHPALHYLNDFTSLYQTTMPILSFYCDASEISYIPQGRTVCFCTIVTSLYTDSKLQGIAVVKH
jgi:hypothetical protein